MKKPTSPALLYVDQYGNRFRAHIVKELRAQIKNGKSRVSKMFVDGNDGRTYHTGYVIGGHWLQGYTPMRNPA